MSTPQAHLDATRSPSVTAVAQTTAVSISGIAESETEGITDRSIPLELLKLKNAEVAALQGHIARTTALYFAVMGALFKFAFDASSTPALRSVLAAVGVATSGVFCLAALFAHQYRQVLIGTLSRLHENLGLQSFREDLPGIRYSIVLALFIALVVITTWAIVLIAKIGI